MQKQFSRRDDLLFLPADEFVVQAMLQKHFRNLRFTDESNTLALQFIRNTAAFHCGKFLCKRYDPFFLKRSNSILATATTVIQRARLFGLPSVHGARVQFQYSACLFETEPAAYRFIDGRQKCLS